MAAAALSNNPIAVQTKHQRGAGPVGDLGTLAVGDELIDFLLRFDRTQPRFGSYELFELQCYLPADVDFFEAMVSTASAGF